MDGRWALSKGSEVRRVLVLCNLLLDGKMHKSSIRGGLFKLRFTADHKYRMNIQASSVS